ncbi:MAG: restriction endonuclease subunit S, partial [Planctomycetaceae bacterium]|nr:restriction endonuclease subunit S [Planctomycetaceae bacterium]
MTSMQEEKHIHSGSRKLVKFGDVVRDVKETEKNPLENGLDRYVGLEHIEPENLRLSQWGDLKQDEVSFTKRFRKGEVLFAKRRAYQRKVAVADFDGICSSDILTFEPKGDDLLPELLPYIVQSDAFFDHALGTSSGSLSPRTRWSQLKDFEFPLPPKEEQRRIAELLKTASSVIQSTREVIDSTNFARRRVLASSLGELGLGKSVSFNTLWSDSPFSGYSPVPAPQETGHYVLTLSALSHDGYVPGWVKPVNLDHRSQATILRKGDLLISRSNTTELVGLTGIF